MTMIGETGPGRAPDLPPAEADLLRRRERVLGPAYRLFYGRPLHIVRGQGVWLYDPDGNAYLDAYNNVPCVGHGNSRVLRAVADQAAILNTHTRYLTDGIVDYAERLTGYFPGPLGNLLLACTGSEANDLACRLARRFTGGDGFIVTRNAYHGWTSAVAALSPSLDAEAGGAGASGGASGSGGAGEFVRCVTPPGGNQPAGADPGTAFAKEVRAAAADLRAHGVRPAALLVDTVFSSDGILPDPPEALQPAVQAIHAEGGLFIADEVQAGFARLGPAMWGFARRGVTPDIVTLGKPMGNGYPVAGVVTRPDITAAFGERTRYFNTFGGNPVACAAGMAVLDVIEGEGLRQQVADVGGYLAGGIRQLANGHEVIGDVRAAGLFIGAEIVADRDTRAPAPEVAGAIVDGLRARRVLVSTTGPAENVVKIRPPLVFQRNHADLLLTAFGEVLAELAP